MEELHKKIEAILFYSGEPVSINFLSKLLEVKNEDVLEALSLLKQGLALRGVRLLEADGEYSLVTAPELSELIEKMIKEEREKDLGKAGIETLSIIAYKGPVSKRSIEYIRGVNSQYALRNLLLRGLVQKKPSQNDERMLEYTLTTEALRFLGLSRINDLPEYEESRKELEEVRPLDDESNEAKN